jgi:leucyl-tRNA synthetase
MRFGGGAVLGVPALDATDAAIAEHLGLAAWSSEAEDHQADLTPACRYRLRDNSISRQRSWGAPIPIIHCEVCGQVPVPDADLPVRLPDTLIPTGEGNALARHPTFAHCNCPRCGGRARRDTDTLDVHFDSIWMLVPFCVPPQARVKSMFTHPELRRWLPVAQVVCGADQAGWWMNDRLFFRVMRDCGYFKDLKDSEPVRKLLMHEMVLSDGRKMSKSLGNAVDPDDLVHRFGADAVRLSVLKVNPRKSFNWTEEALRENYQFLSDLWNFTHEFVVARTSAADDNVACDPSLRKLARCSAAAQRKGSAAFESRSFHLVQKELKLLFDAIRRTWIEIERAHIPGIAEAIAVQDAISIVLDLLEPLAPHISSELNTKLNRRVIPASTTSAAIHRGPGKEAIGDKVSNISLTRTSIGHQ